MYYKIRHLTRYRYDAPIQENMMEARMQPRTEGPQQCRQFELSVTPRTEVFNYRDYLGNIIHYFNIPGQHSQLTVAAEALVQVDPILPLPTALPDSAWAALDCLADDGAFWEMLHPSVFTEPTPTLRDFAGEVDLARRADPLTILRDLNEAIYNAFDYTPQSTKVDSPIAEALVNRSGVCQDFTHIMLALIRLLKIPCRYVSGYLYHRSEDRDRSAEDATHAWVEAYLPDLGWVGFDPTNNLMAGERHIRVAIGRDYADVPPTRGIFRGDVEATLTVGVRVSLIDHLAESDEFSLPEAIEDVLPATNDETLQRQQQQQQ